MTEHSFDVAVIGGGPAGSRTAALIARAGYSVGIIEEHERVGEPVQCAGLITPRCFDLLGHGKGTILNDIRGADIISPSGQLLPIGNREIRAHVIDRAAFDRDLADHALDSGAKLLSGMRVKDLQLRKGAAWLNGGDIRARLVIAADGARSPSRDWLGLGSPEHVLRGFAADVTGPELDTDRVRIFFGRDIAPNFFAWMIPAGEVTRLGLCVRGTDETAHRHFKRLFERGETVNHLKGAKVLRTYSGTIPLGMLRRTFSDSAMAVGDAACQVKATSGGGIYPGLVCASHCARVAVRALELDDLSSKVLAGYHEAWTRDIGDELRKALMMHRVYCDLEPEQLEDIFEMMRNPDVLKTINAEGDMDYPSRLGWALLRREPGLLRYAGLFLKHGIMGW